MKSGGGGRIPHGSALLGSGKSRDPEIREGRGKGRLCWIGSAWAQIAGRLEFGA